MASQNQAEDELTQPKFGDEQVEEDIFVRDRWSEYLVETFSGDVKLLIDKLTTDLMFLGELADRLRAGEILDGQGLPLVGGKGVAGAAGRGEEGSSGGGGVYNAHAWDSGDRGSNYSRSTDPRRSRNRDASALRPRSVTRL